MTDSPAFHREMDTAMAAPPQALPCFSPVLPPPPRLLSSPQFETGVAISMRTYEHLRQSPNPFIALTEAVPCINPPPHTRVPHAFAPVTHRYMPYTRVMALAPPISFTVRESKVPRNERGVASVTRTHLNIINATALSSFVASHSIIPVMSSGPTPPTEPYSLRGQMGLETPTLIVGKQSQDDPMQSGHFPPKTDDKRNSETE